MEKIIYSDGTLHIFKSGVQRENFRKHFIEIDSVNEFKATLRAGPYTELGAYPLNFYFTDYEALCYHCAKSEYKQIISAIKHKNDKQWEIAGCEITPQDTYLTCIHCEKILNQAEDELEGLPED